MYQRNMCPTMAALRRTFTADIAAAPKSASRAFSVSARRLEESNSAAPPASAPANADSRKARSANALSQITRLGANRRSQPGGLAKGVFPSGQTDGQMARRGPPRAPREPAQNGAQDGAVRAEGGLKITREMVGPSDAQDGGRPSGPMARAPAQLKLARNSGQRGGGNNNTVGGRRGPNLRARDGKSGGGGGANRGPKRRERKEEGNEEKQIEAGDIERASTLNDGMIKHLLRLQRKEWDRTPYEPKYKLGSFAANQLVHQGREFFRGEAPPVKIWGALEKRIGVVGMHNAEAHLQVRRVPFDDHKLSDRRQYDEQGDVETKGKTEIVKSETTEPATSVYVPHVVLAKVPALKQRAVS